MVYFSKEIGRVRQMNLEKEKGSHTTMWLKDEYPEDICVLGETQIHLPTEGVQVPHTCPKSTKSECPVQDQAKEGGAHSSMFLCRLLDMALLWSEGTQCYSLSSQ